MLGATGVLLVPFAALGLTGCGAAGDRAADASVVPVVTSVVGAAGPAGSVPGTTPPPSSTPVPGAAPRGYGEPETPMAMPTTTAADLGPDAPAVADAARGFLAVFWAGGQRSYGQLADELAPYATEKLLAEYRQPSRAGRPAAEPAVIDHSVEVQAAGDTTATAVGRGTSTAGTRQASVWRTLALVKDEAGAWKVDSLR
jgi:hypothetical protein